ncbi:MAG: 50S ribosome-binding GTPase [Planctomycetales bacterium]|nr:50S ribosome-binding GTPase [Planctomycetales bacterium]
MPLDTDDTIVATASASGGAARAVVRISGPAAAQTLGACFVQRDAPAGLPNAGPPRLLAGRIRIATEGAQPPRDIPADLSWWPTNRSYTRQPVGELQLPGSPPLVQAVVDALCAAGARPARPGEFTLRAFLAGRLDLTQAEAVLGVIDARGAGDLDAALVQLAGGLSQPLGQLRSDLLDLLAELEAGLDFADEEIEFIAADELQRRLAVSQDIVAATRTQLQVRGAAAGCPRAVLAGPPNAGKSSLFNALAERYGIEPAHTPAIVSAAAGTTRDYLVVRLNLDGVLVDLVDTAGADAFALDEIELSAQRATDAQRHAAEVQLTCIDAATLPPPSQGGAGGGTPSSAPYVSDANRVLALLTKSDQYAPAEIAQRLAQFPGAHLQGWLGTQRSAAPSGATLDPAAAGLRPVAVSSRTGDGIEQLAERLRSTILDLHDEVGHSAVAATALRTADSLRHADAALAAAITLTAQRGQEDLIAAEIRTALHALGEVVGAVYVDDVLDRIFSQFCIGK